ncbi:MAG: aldehyde dehydrogenase family protein [Anaerolineales bacterium]
MKLATTQRKRTPMTEAIPQDVNLQDATLAFLGESPKKLLINNEWVPAQDGSTFETRNPANGRVLAEVTQAGNGDVDAAVAAARHAFEAGPWGKMGGTERAALLHRLGDLILDHVDELAELETLDNGKPLRVSSRGDVPFAAKHLHYYAGWADKLQGDTIPVSIPDKLVYTLRQPMGVVGLIIPWNFPLLMAAWKLGPALAAGNTTLLKPAEETPLTALRLGELIVEAGFPPGVVNILTGPGVPTGAAISQHMGVDKISFTGSTEVGRRIMEASAGSNLKKISLELGGKSPNVIFGDADLSSAIRGAHWACFSTSGQECTAGSRLLVEESVYDQVAEGLIEQAEKLRVGSGFAPKVHVGPIVSERQLDRVLGYIDDGRENSAEMLTGGERLGGDLSDGYFLSPTIFAHDDDSLPLVQEEIFGPVLALTSFSDWDELIARANSTRYGLAAGVWTQDISKAHRFANAVQAGTVWVNCYGLYDAAAPFGGTKESGFGREMGEEALDLYTQTKTVWIGL